MNYFWDEWFIDKIERALQMLIKLSLQLHVRFIRMQMDYSFQENADWEYKAILMVKKNGNFSYKGKAEKFSKIIEV